jgi:Pyridoxamine 5'-phosphate oxidase
MPGTPEHRRVVSGLSGYAHGMTEREPVDVTNLDRYGDPALPWERAHELLSAPSKGPALTHFLGTVRPDGRPHSAGIGAVWHAGTYYFTSGPGTRKSRNLAEQPACTISARLEGLDVVLEGEATRVVDPDTLEALAQIYRDVGWPAEVEGDAFTAPFSAPSAGPPPWQLYRFAFHTVIGVATAEPHGATRWRFAG